MRRYIIGSVAIGCVLLVSASTFAKKNVPDFALVFLPQQTVAGAEPLPDGSMTRRSGRIHLLDGRNLEDESVIGKRTDDDDRRFTLRATNEVLPFVEQVLVDSARDWGVLLSRSPDVTLRTTLLQFHVAETNQAVGATYEAAVAMQAELTDPGDTVLWSGSASGDATRYGKKFSSENCNEVLSDASLEVWADLLISPGLGKAWRGEGK